MKHEYSTKDYVIWRRANHGGLHIKKIHLYKKDDENPQESVDVVEEDRNATCSGAFGSVIAAALDRYQRETKIRIDGDRKESHMILKAFQVTHIDDITGEAWVKGA